MSIIRDWMVGAKSKISDTNSNLKYLVILANGKLLKDIEHQSAIK